MGCCRMCFDGCANAFGCVSDSYRMTIACRSSVMSANNPILFLLFVVFHVCLLTVQLWYANSPDQYFLSEVQGADANPYDWIFLSDGTVYANISDLLIPNCTYEYYAFENLKLDSDDFNVVGFYLLWKQFYYINICSTALLAAVWVTALWTERLEEHSHTVANVFGWRCSRTNLTIAKRSMAVAYIAVIPLLLPALVLYREFFQKCGLSEAREYLADFEAVPFVFKLLSIWWISLFLVVPAGFVLMAVLAALLDTCTCHCACCAARGRSLLTEVVGLTRQQVLHFSPSDPNDVGGFPSRLDDAQTHDRITHSQYGSGAEREAIAVDVLLPSSHPGHGPAHRRDRSEPALSKLDAVAAADDSGLLTSPRAGGGGFGFGGGGADGQRSAPTSERGNRRPIAAPTSTSGGFLSPPTSRSDAGGSGGGGGGGGTRASPGTGAGVSPIVRSADELHSSNLNLDTNTSAAITDPEAVAAAAAAAAAAVAATERTTRSDLSDYTRRHSSAADRGPSPNAYPQHQLP